MEIITTTQNTVTVMHVNGNIDSATFQAFQSIAEELIANDARHLLVDMTNAPFISSAGLRALHNIFNQLRAIHKDADDDSLRKSMSKGAYKSPYLKVCCLSKESKEVFELGGFDTYIEVYNNLEAAVSSF
jgi:anti-anti-sigma regulatory factor